MSFPSASPAIRLICLSAHEGLRESLEAALAPFDRNSVTLEFVAPDAAPGDLAAALDDATGVLCGEFPRALHLLAPRLKWVQFWHAGLETRIYPELFQDGVTVTNASGIHATACSEHVLAQMLAFARGLPLSFQAQQERVWRRDTISEIVFELEGKTVGIVGAGAIGQAIGTRCQAFGMRTVGTRRDPNQPTPGIDIVLSHIQYHDLILASDLIVLALPLTPSTRMLFGEDEIEILRKGTYLFNIGRGGLLDDKWVIRALQNRWIAGAGLDVFTDEPLPADSPFWTLPNCIVTPHVGGMTPLYWPRFAALVARQVTHLRNDEPLENQFDKNLGY